MSGQAYRIINAAGGLTVTARPITVAADAQNRVYGDANPLLTYQIRGPGLVNGDTLSGGLATPAAATSNVGAYAITQGTLANANYSIAYTSRRSHGRRRGRSRWRRMRRAAFTVTPIRS